MPVAGPIKRGPFRGPLGRRQLQFGRVASPAPVFGGRTGLWIAGVDYTALLRAHSPVIRSTSYAQTGVFSFTLHGHVPSVPAEQVLIRAVAVEQDVNWNVGGVIYGGLIRAITPEDRNRTDYLVINVECQDYTALLAGSICAYSNPYTNPLRSVIETDAQRIAWLLQSYDRYGITAYHVQPLTASMPPQDFTGMTLTDAIKAVLAFGNGSFYVDVFKDLHAFTGSEPNPAPFALADVPDNVTSFGFTAFTYPRDSVDLKNAIYGICGQAAPLPTIADKVIESITTTPTPASGGAQLVTIKAASAGWAPVGNFGALVYGTATSVSPAFGQPTIAGDTLVAWVTASASGDPPTTTAPGWARISAPTTGWVAIWLRPNCGAAEAAPVFTGGAAGLSLMSAQLGEFSGLPSGLADQGYSLTFGGVLSIPLVAAAPDKATGNLILTASKWEGGGATASFGDVFNNGAAGGIAGSGVDVSAGNKAQNNTWAIMPGVPGAAPTWYVDPASVAAYGRLEASFTDTTVTTQAALDALGAAYLAAHKTPLQHCSLKCWQLGLTAGMTINVTNALYGLVAQPFRIQGLTITYPVDNAPLFEVQFADPIPTVATQMVKLQAQQATSVASANAATGAVAAAISANPLGTIGYAQIVAAQALISGQVDIAGLASTVTVGAGRRIRITAYCANFSGTVATDKFSVQIWEGATQLQSQASCVEAAAAGGNASTFFTVTAIVQPSAGLHTYKVGAVRNNGTGTGTFGASATAPAFINVEDIGT